MADTLAEWGRVVAAVGLALLLAGVGLMGARLLFWPPPYAEVEEAPPAGPVVLARSDERS